MTLQLHLYTDEQWRVIDLKYVRHILTNVSWSLAHGGWILSNDKWSDWTLSCYVNDRRRLAGLQKWQVDCYIYFIEYTSRRA